MQEVTDSVSFEKDYSLSMIDYKPLWNHGKILCTSPGVDSHI